MTDTNTQQAPDPQEGGRYERNTDGSLKTIHQTGARDTAQYALEKAKRQAGEDGDEVQPAGTPAAPNDDHAQE
jgi:hypothetical protein